MSHARLLIAVVVTFASPVGLNAGEKTGIQELLTRPILDGKLPLTEVQDYCDSRIPAIPEVTNLEQWEKYANEKRRETLRRVVFRGEAARWRTAKTKVEWLETIAGGAEYRIKKLRYEALPGLWIPALLYEPKKLEGKVPVILNVNGHDRNGKAAKYKQIRCINQAKRGMLALNVEWLGMGQLNIPNLLHYRMNQLDLCGTSGLSPFYLSLSRGLDLLLALEHADPKRVAVTGLSGGGCQTILISGLDTRVTLANPVAGYSSFHTRARYLTDLGDSEQTPVDMAVTGDYALLTAMRAPRPTLLTYNAQDHCCFRADHALPPLLNAAGPVFKLYGKSGSLRSHINVDPGNHNYELDNRQQLYKMFGDFFYTGVSSFNPKEIPCEDEVKTKEQLHVKLPENNANFHSLAIQLSKSLPRDSDIPTSKQAIAKWQTKKRKQLREIVKSKEYNVQAVLEGEADRDKTHAKFWRFRLDGTWTVPGVELVRGEPKSTVLLVADAGRRSTDLEVEKLLAAGNRVLAVDPFYFGESKIPQRDYLYGLLISAVGDRPLGLQASQLVAIARWSKRKFGGQPVAVHALGPRSSLYSLVAAGLEPKAIASVELNGSLGSLKEILEQNKTVQEAPELFCFGLLEHFDIKQLAALVAPRRVRFLNPSDRLQSELKPQRE